MMHEDPHSMSHRWMWGKGKTDLIRGEAYLKSTNRVSVGMLENNEEKSSCFSGLQLEVQFPDVLYCISLGVSFEI